MITKQILPQVSQHCLIRQSSISILSQRTVRRDESVKELMPTTLETRRLRGDQIEVFKILNGYENIDSNIFF